MLVSENQKPTDYNEGIDLALTIATHWGLSLEERARLFAFEEPVDDKPEYLAQQLKLSRRADIWRRVELIFEINTSLHEAFDTAETKKRWLGVKHRELHDKSIKDLLITGTLAQLSLAAFTVRQINT